MYAYDLVCFILQLDFFILLKIFVLIFDAE